MKPRYIRWFLTAVLLYFCWAGKLWAINLAITLLIISLEIIELGLSKFDKEK